MSRIGLCRTLVAVTACAGLGCLAPAARAQPVPAGFEIVRLTYDLGIHSVPDINDRGDVVWSSTFLPPIDESDIWLYRDGQVQQVTNDHWYDTHPAINNSGMMTWMRSTGYYGRTFIVYDVGFGPQAAPDPGGIHGVSPQINDDGLIVWVQRLGLNPSVDEIFSYDYKSGTFRQLTDNGLSNQAARLNRYGDVVWTRYDFRVSPWTSTIVLRCAGEIVELAGTPGTPQSPDLNDQRQVVWAYTGGSPRPGVYLWDGGNVSVLDEQGRGPRINGRGHIVYPRWNEARQAWDMWLYRRGEFLQIPDMGAGFLGANINNRGEIAWREFTNTYGDTAVYLMRRVGLRPAKRAVAPVPREE